MADRRPILVLLGPTASGKTALSLEVAARMPVEIISADSRQIYKHMDIGTAKPTAGQRRAAPHHFVDILDPAEEFNAGEFGRAGRQVIGEIIARRKLPFIVGGSGLYLRGLIDGFFEGPGADRDLRKILYERMHEEGPEVLLAELRERDPAAASSMLPSNTRRIVRALELIALTGSTVTELRRNKPAIGFSPVFVGLAWERPGLYERINRRVDRMIEDGLIDEVTRLKEMGYSPGLNALQTTGYVEVFAFLEGKLTRAQMVDLIKRNTRRYAKRQMTWFRPDHRIQWIKVEDEEEFPKIAERIVNMIK